jgi:uroporphyrinogen-III synthase
MTLRRVLITRAAQQTSELAGCLRAAGIKPILIPTIETIAPTSFAPLDDALNQLVIFPWLIFTSANAVEAFTKRVPHLRDGFIAAKVGEVAPSLKVAAIGPATVRAAEAAGLHVDIIPPQAVAESLADVLLAHVLQPDGTPTRFLLVRAEQARDHLPETLRAAGADVTIAPAYRTVIPESSIPAIRDLFSRPENYPDAVTFTSSSTAHNLLALLEAAGLTLPPEILRASIGPITSQTLTQLGFPAHIEAKEPSVVSLAVAIVERLR